jgi:beta-glucosidase/6-phospho-beta-glucosidase/beta-galactosidase
VCLLHLLVTVNMNFECRIVVENFAHLVDYWVTFNEPHVFAMLTYCAGAWPGGHPDLLEVATSVMPQGVFNHVTHWMAVAHSKAFDLIHDFRSLLSYQYTYICKGVHTCMQLTAMHTDVVDRDKIR